MQQYLQNKEGLVENVFNKVFDKKQNKIAGEGIVLFG